MLFKSDTDGERWFSVSPQVNLIVEQYIIMVWPHSVHSFHLYLKSQGIPNEKNLLNNVTASN